jgi:hypothetical protein
LFCLDLHRNCFMSDKDRLSCKEGILLTVKKDSVQCWSQEKKSWIDDSLFADYSVTKSSLFKVCILIFERCSFQMPVSETDSYRYVRGRHFCHWLWRTGVSCWELNDTEKSASFLSLLRTGDRVYETWPYNETWRASTDSFNQIDDKQQEHLGNQIEVRPKSLMQIEISDQKKQNYSTNYIRESDAASLIDCFPSKTRVVSLLCCLLESWEWRRDGQSFLNKSSDCESRRIPRKQESRLWFSLRIGFCEQESLEQKLWGNNTSLHSSRIDSERLSRLKRDNASFSWGSCFVTTNSMEGQDWTDSCILCELCQLFVNKVWFSLLVNREIKYFFILFGLQLFYQCYCIILRLDNICYGVLW